MLNLLLNVVLEILSLTWRILLVHQITTIWLIRSQNFRAWDHIINLLLRLNLRLLVHLETLVIHVLNSLFARVFLKHFLNTTWKWPLLSFSGFTFNHHLLRWRFNSYSLTSCEFCLIFVNRSILWLLALLFFSILRNECSLPGSSICGSLTVYLSFWTRLHDLSCRIRMRNHTSFRLHSTTAGSFTRWHLCWSLILLHLSLYIQILINVAYI